jgi:hypothetical protein
MGRAKTMKKLLPEGAPFLEEGNHRVFDMATWWQSTIHSRLSCAKHEDNAVLAHHVVSI